MNLNLINIIYWWLYEYVVTLGTKKFMILGVIALFIISTTGIPTAYALEPDQKTLYNRNIKYYDLANCGEESSASGVGDTLDGHTLPAAEGGTGLESYFDSYALGTPDTPEENDYYITMRWRYALWNWDGTSTEGPEDYEWYLKHPRVLVTNPETGKSLIAAVLESGPAPWTGVDSGNNNEPKQGWTNPQDGTPEGYKGRVSGLPPKGFEALGMTSADQRTPEGGVSLQYSWAEDQNATPGPVNSPGVAASTSSSGESSANCECSSDASDNLSDKLKELSEKNGGKTQISVSSIDGEQVADYGGDMQMPTRSSYKIYTAYATLKAIEAGKISWGTKTSWGQSVENTMEAMIVSSDNDAAEALRNDSRIGNYREVTNVLQSQVGLSNKTVMGNGNYASATGSNSKSTANDFTKFLTLMYKNKLPGVNQKSNYNKLISYMKKATTDGASARDGIAAGVGGDTQVADKPGWAPSGPDQASNDVGIVYLEDNPYVLSILTNKPNEWDGVANIAKEVNGIMGGDGANCASSTGDLPSTVKAYAWPTYSASRSDPKDEWRRALDKAGREGMYIGGGYTDCGAYVTRVMIDSGFEPEYNSKGKGGNTLEQQPWLDENWKKINASSTKDLQPGDVAINTSHTFMFVGDIPGFESDLSSASLNSRVAMAGQGGDIFSGYSWYRKK